MESRKLPLEAVAFTNLYTSTPPGNSPGGVLVCPL